MKRALTGLVIFAGVFLLLCAPALAFPDVPAGHAYEAAVNDLSSRGIISGYTNGKFGLSDPVKRAQFAKMVVGTLGITPNTSTTSRFTDLGLPDAAGYPHVFVQAAYAHGITNGTNTAQTLFAPWNSIRRDQMVSMVVRGAKSLLPGTLKDPPAGTASYFSGVPEPHGANLRIAQYNGLLDGLLGMGAGWQNANATRGEVAQMLCNLLSIMQPDVPETTKVLDAAALLELKSVSSDQAVLVFGTSSSVPALAPGDVIVAGVSSATPTGLLRKVASVSNGGSTVTVKTTAATLQDAIPEGSFSVSATLSPETLSPASATDIAPDGAHPLGAAALSGNLGATISYQNQSFGVGTVSVTGNTSLSQPPDIDFSSNWDLDDLWISADFSAEVTSTLTVTASPDCMAARKWDLLQKPLTFEPIVVFVSWVPVVIVPTLQFQLEVSATVSHLSAVSQSVVHTSRLTAGASYDDGGVTGRADFSNTFSSPVVTSGGHSASLRGSVGPVITLALYGVAGPSLNVDGFLDLSVQPTQAPPWVLSGGLQAGIGFSIPYLGVSASIPNLIEWSETILEGSGDKWKKSDMMPQDLLATLRGMVEQEDRGAVHTPSAFPSGWAVAADGQDFGGQFGAPGRWTQNIETDNFGFLWYRIWFTNGQNLIGCTRTLDFEAWEGTSVIYQGYELSVTEPNAYGVINVRAPSLGDLVFYGDAALRDTLLQFAAEPTIGEE